MRAAAELPSIYGLRGLTYAHAVRPDRRHRPADQRGARPGPGRRRSRRRRAHHPARQARQGAAAAARRQRDGPPARLHRRARPPAGRARLRRSSSASEGSRAQRLPAPATTSRRSASGIGLRSDQQYKRHGRGPRIHDLRHTFAARTMIGWYRSGRDPAREMVKLTTYLGHATPEHTYWYIEAVPELLELAARRIDGAQDAEVGHDRLRLPRAPAALLHRAALHADGRQPATRSPAIATPSGCCFASPANGCGRPPTRLRVEDLDADLVADFLAHVENDRGNGARSRNTRLAAIRSFFRFVAMNEPAYLLHCQRILAMPSKRYVQARGQLPGARGDRGVAGRAGSDDVDRPARPHDPPGRPADRAAGLGADQPAPRATSCWAQALTSAARVRAARSGARRYGARPRS